MSKKIESFQIMFFQRNARANGPSSSAHINDMFSEIGYDLANINDYWNSSLVPLCNTLPDSSYPTIDAFAYGLGGNSIYSYPLATVDNNSSYYNSQQGRPYTIFEQFQDLYTTLANNTEDLENQINNLYVTASKIAIEDVMGLYAAANVETALSEVMTKVDSIFPYLGLDLSAVDQNYFPATDISYDIGSASKRIRSIFVSGSSLQIISKTTDTGNPSAKTFKVGIDASSSKLQVLDNTTSILKADSLGVNFDVPVTGIGLNELDDINVSSPSTGQVLKWSGTQWINDEDIGTVPTGSIGSVQWNAGSGDLGGNNNLFYDYSNNQLGLGTNAPANILHLSKSGTDGKDVRIRLQNTDYSTWDISSGGRTGGASWEQNKLIFGVPGVADSPPPLMIANDRISLFNSDPKFPFTCSNWGLAPVIGNYAVTFWNCYYDGSNMRNIADGPAVMFSLQGGASQVGGMELVTYNNPTTDPAGSVLVDYEPTLRIVRPTGSTWGGVGLGISDPSERLHVDGGIRIGTAKASGVGTIQWNTDHLEVSTSDGWLRLITEIYGTGIYGDGHDSNISLDGSPIPAHMGILVGTVYYMIRQWDCNNLTIGTGYALSPGMCILRVKDTLTIESGAYLSRPGKNGNSAVDENGAAAPAWVYDRSYVDYTTWQVPGPFSPTTIHGDGGDGTVGNGTNGATTYHQYTDYSYKANDGNYSLGGAGGNDTSGTLIGGSGGTITRDKANTLLPRGPKISPLEFRSYVTSLDFPVFRYPQGGSGGGGGAGDGVNLGGGGGSGGLSGGWICVHAKTIINQGIIEAAGGNGGNGANGLAVDCGGGGGGGGGCGGWIWLHYDSLSLGTVQYSKGTGGTGGTGANNGVNGQDGMDGYLFRYHRPTGVFLAT